MIKVYHGTARSGDHLCRTCASSTIAQGQRLDDAIIYCGVLDRDIEFPVHSCTTYKPVNAPSLRQMQEDALYIDVNRKTSKVGFTKFADLPNEEKWRDLES